MAHVKLVPRSDPEAAIARVLILPHAGGTAQAYASWAAHFPDEIAVFAADLPQAAVDEGGARGLTLQQMARVLADALGTLPPLPSAIYGHSLGAMLAYALAAELQQKGAAPVHLSVSASRPPHVALKRRKMHTLGDAEFLSELQKLGGTPDQVLRESALMAARLPAMRAHFRALETYAPFTSPAATDVLNSSVLAYGGCDDHLAEADIAAWSALTRSDFAHTMLEGGHFFNRAHAPLIAKGVRVALFRVVARGQGRPAPTPSRSERVHV